MQLSNHDLSQLSEEELLNLSEEELRRLSIKLLTDLKEARERLNQNSHNSSRPPSSEAPWEKDTQKEKDSSNNSEEAQEEDTSDKKESPPIEKSDKLSQQSPRNGTEEQRKPGKQPGAKGFGRQQKIAITDYKEHFPETCECCHQPLNVHLKKAYTAFETIDIVWSDEKNPGMRLTNTKHTYYESTCHCGHITIKEPHRSNSHGTLQDIGCSQWRLVGPGLASLIICLTYRMRLSRERVQEFLCDWLGLQLSVGTINNTLHESGAAAMPIEAELVKEVVESQLLHVDETSWMELTTFLWLWVFSTDTDTVTAYWISTRSSELIENILGQAYCGWLMSDGYQVYRKYLNRIRCWAHLIRKAKGLKEGLDKDSQLFGEQTLKL